MFGSTTRLEMADPPRNHLEKGFSRPCLVSWEKAVGRPLNHAPANSYPHVR